MDWGEISVNLEPSLPGNVACVELAVDRGGEDGGESRQTSEPSGNIAWLQGRFWLSMSKLSLTQSVVT